MTTVPITPQASVMSDRALSVHLSAPDSNGLTAEIEKLAT